MRTLLKSRSTASTALALLLAAFPSLSRETVLEDSPGRLVIEVEVPSYSVTPGAGGASVRAPGIPGSGAAIGAPDLAAYGFSVVSGARQPSVSVEALEWIEVETPGGVRGVPRPKSIYESEPFKDPALFAAASGLAPQVHDGGLYRGFAMRRIALPLGTYTEGASRARMLKRFKVTVSFAGSAASPSPGVQPWLERAGVKNTRGGAYLVSMPRRQALRRAAGAANFAGGTGLIKIRVGDGQLDGFEEDGMYSLSYETARALGMSGAVDTARLRVYAGPNAPLAIAMGAVVEPTLREIPIQVIEGTTNGNPNGTFDAGDRIVFYGQGTSRWKPLAGDGGPIRWEFENDPWSLFNHYYFDWTGDLSGALRLPTTPFTATAAIVDAAPHYLRGERDLGTGVCDPAGTWDGETGHIWYWHNRAGCEGAPGFQSSTPTIPGGLLGSAAADTLRGRASDTVRIAFFTHPASSGITVRPWLQGDEDEAISVGDLGTSSDWRIRVGNFQSDVLGIDSAKWVGGGGRLEGFTVRYTRNLTWDGRLRRIFPARDIERLTYRITVPNPTDPASLSVVRVVKGVAQARLATQVGVNTALFSDSVGIGDDVHYVVYQNSKNVTEAAASLEAVPGVTGVLANLKTGDDVDPEYLIITSQLLVPEALQLRTYRQDPKRQLPLVTSVVRVEDIYRDWSGGRMSPPAIRDFLRHALKRWNSGQPRLKYVLLLGDGHYDYRDLRNGASNSRKPNIVPPFNWIPLPDDTNPMSTDDFYAVLDSAENWETSSGALDLALGRVPAQTREHARNYIEKITDYENPATAGEWRGRILLTADDATQRRNQGGLDPITWHTTQSEDLGKEILALDSGMRMEKVYLFDYNPNASFLKPEATQDLLNQYNRGVLFSNFYGHGAYDQLADEVLLKTNDGLTRLRNTDKAFTMMVLSCTVGRFDKLLDEGMTEQFLRQKDAATIAAIGASRESYPSQNESLGEAIVRRLFGASSDSTPMLIGEAIRLAKNEIGNQYRSNSQKYVLIGEPVAIIHRPGLGMQLNAAPDSLQALGCGTFSGRVTKGSGNGRISVRIVSGDVTKVYPHNNVVDKRGQILFESTSDYKDSVFLVNYFLPQKVPFGDTAAKIQIFAWDKEQPLESSYLIPDLKISGTLGNCHEDTDGLGPRISVTGCNLAESGGVDFPNKIKIALPYCLEITVKDTVGGVLSGDGPDEGTTVEVVGRMAPFHPQAGTDDLYTKTYQTTLTGQDLPEGTHLFKVSARDGFGNRGVREIALQVTQDTALRFVKAFNVPNPMKRNGTTFHFATTLPVEEGFDRTSVNVDRIRFDLRIFNQQGYMVQEFRDAKSGLTTWNGKDAWGRQLANGVYFYQVTATWNETNGSPAGGRKTSKKNVLVISR